MRKLLSILALIGFILLAGCAPTQEQPPANPQPEKPPAVEPQQPPVTEPQQPPVKEPEKPPVQEPKQPKTYGNEIFKGVTVEKLDEETYKVKGKARVFEASFSYVVEDGHNELLQGHSQTSAGAPEWGDFEVTIKVKKTEPNSTLTLILFEVSAKDGSRRLELPIPLP